MTVRRHAEQLLDAPQGVVADAVRAVLGRKPYRNNVEVEQGVRFLTNVKPSWWLMGTQLTITVRPSLSPAGRTQVTADTESQWFILGDVYGFYDKYLSAFLRDLEAAVAASR